MTHKYNFFFSKGSLRYFAMSSHHVTTTNSDNANVRDAFVKNNCEYDIFETVNDIENIYIKQGREDAKQELEDKLVDSGAYEIGLKHGNDLGNEFGFYYGVVSTIAEDPKHLELYSNKRQTRILHVINNLKSQIEKLLSRKPSNEDFDTEVLDIRFLYKKFCAMLLVKDKSTPIFVNNSKTGLDDNENYSIETVKGLSLDF